MAAAKPAQALPVDGEADLSEKTLLELPPLIHQRVLSLLPPSDLCTATQVCTALAAASAHDSVWHAVAHSRWPADSVILHGSYATHKKLTLDDNRHNTAWYYPLEASTSCNYVFSQDDYFFQCRLIGMERTRGGSKELRLYYDARGESDLREPGTSMLTMKLKLGAMAAHNTVVCACAPSEVEEYVNIPGHSKGCFKWGAVVAGSIENAMSFDEDDAGTVVEYREAVLAYGCNPVGVVDEAEGLLGFLADYAGGSVMSLQQGQGFEEVWRAGAVLTAKGAMGRQLAAEGEEEQRRRWADLPQGVKARGSGWPGADGFGAWPSAGQ